MNYDINFPGVTDLQCCINKSLMLAKIHETGLAEDGLGSNLLNLLNNLLGLFLAALGDVVDHNIGTSLGKQNSDAGTNTTGYFSAKQIV